MSVDYIHRRQSLNPTLPSDSEELSEDISKQYKKYQSSAKFDLNSEEVFCICRRPDHGELMICCDGCEEWFHFRCMRLDLRYSPLVAKFFCKFCQWKGVGFTKWKKKCRLDGCFQGIANESKYCSEEHGKKFMRDKLGLRKEAKTPNALSSNKILQILNYIDLDHEKFRGLGSTFPELPEVSSYLEGAGDISQFPEEVRVQLELINTKLTTVKGEILHYESRIDYLVRIKEMIKSVNERLQGVLSKKKLDLCYYDKQIEEKGLSSLEEVSAGRFDELKALIEERLNDETDATTLGDLCVQDRRKCIRHNGWWNLVNDELEKKLVAMNRVVKMLEEEKGTVLRGYSVGIYESILKGSPHERSE